MAEPTGVESLAHALEQVAGGMARTRPVSVSLPGPLVEALQQLASEGLISSTSAVATEALTQWAYNKLLRLELDEIYDEQPDLRPRPEQVQAMAQRLGSSPRQPADADEVA